MTITPVPRAEENIERVLRTYGDMLLRVCIVILCNRHDAEDAISETLIRYMCKAPEFTGPEHEKAWLIRVATNVCKDIKRYRSRHSCLDIDDVSVADGRDSYESGEKREVLEAVMRLPDKYKTILYLFYVEGCKTDELSRLLALSPSAVRKRLQYGRELLKTEYGKE